MTHFVKLKLVGCLGIQNTFIALEKRNMTVVLCLSFLPGNINGNKGHFLSLDAVRPTCYQ